MLYICATENSMEQLLLKLARQLDALDEASLMALWNQYAARVSRFEPTKRWEESALVFSLLQAKRWKNQLFNYNWALQARPAPQDAPQNEFFMEQPVPAPEAPRQPCNILRFRSDKNS